MQKLGLNEIRDKFIKFYEKKQHYVAESASLIPKDDKSLLLINSGMAPLKPFFAGIETPPAKRMVTCQKCVRTGDIENVGKTSRHGTFFEMLGNFSFGDYFKKESLKWGMEFIFDVLKLPKEKIWVTVYKEDDEAYEIWKNLGMPEDRIVRLGKEDNFWEIGLGPCGPCSEIYFDRGENYACDNPDCKPGCDCDRYIEFWNHVFTQFSKREDGTYSNLKHPNIDTGMGLERIACIVQGVDSIFDIDTIRYTLDKVAMFSSRQYEAGDEKTDEYLRVIADHMRSTVFLISDGVIPSNEGRGYILRRLIRRAARDAKLLDIKEGSLSKIAESVIEVSKGAYPELAEKRDYILKIIFEEEKNFNHTLKQGLDIISTMIDEAKKNKAETLDGNSIFKLYDTYGFPPELTQEILSENSIGADMAGFEKMMLEQKNRARKGRKNTEKEAWKKTEIPENISETEFLGYQDKTGSGKIIHIITKTETETVKKGEEAIVIFDRTPFYAESGGQQSDVGLIQKEDGSKARVISVDKNKGVFLHKIEVTDGSFNLGDDVNQRIDLIRRNRTARNHTATHLLHKALKDVLGSHIEQAGSFVSDESLRFDFTHFQGASDDELKHVERLVNDRINEFIPVNVREMPKEEALKLGATALFGDKYADYVRVVSCGDFSVELCGGTHVENTGQIGAFKIIGESGIAAGIRRIEAITGDAILKKLIESNEKSEKLADTLGCKPDNILNKAEACVNELQLLKKELSESKKADIKTIADECISESEEVNDKKIICKKLQAFNNDDMLMLADNIKDKTERTVIVLANENSGRVNFLIALTKDLVDEGLHAGKIIKEVAKTCGGGGGGRPGMAQAGGRNPENIEKAFIVAKSMI